MLTGTMKSTLIAGKAAALAMLLGTAAYAQVSVETPDGTNVTVPQAAIEGQAPVATTPDTGYEVLAQTANDEVIVSSLESQGYTSVMIARDGTVLTVLAERDGQPIELIYSTATGRLISVDGVPVGPSESDFVVIDGAVQGEAPTPPAATTGEPGIGDTETDNAALNGTVGTVMPDEATPDEAGGTDGSTEDGSTDGDDGVAEDAGADGDAESGAETDGEAQN
ncbi:MAG: hypothetical protein ACK41U_14155 [Paracoccus sp. (in: a-proteobacteria)]|uniref:hypothetical protein n=1 Tax=Paracoccus sp. TaxID=267 RepID=UPI00391C067F